MKIPEITIIIPIYNVEKHIERCLKSVLDQNFESIEYILIDDCGNDNSIAKAKILISNHPNKNKVIFLKHPENMGVAESRNTGILNSKGKYILHCDSDDYLEPEIVAKMYKMAIECNADIIITDYYDELPSKSIYRKQNIGKSSQVSSHCFINQLLTYKLAPAVWNKLIRSSLYKKNNVFHPNGIVEDVCSIVMLAYFAKGIYKLNLPSVHYVQHPQSASSNPQKAFELLSAYKILADFFIIQDAFSIFKNNLSIFQLKQEYSFLSRTLQNLDFQNKHILCRSLNFKHLLNGNLTFKQKLILYLYIIKPNISNRVLRDWNAIAKHLSKIRTLYF